ncbi:MAG: hypothetical protein IH959_00470 [Chloroflexi bacterium]|nr:hypothetical protein [Chloroflexota bacterium]
MAKRGRKLTKSVRETIERWDDRGYSPPDIMAKLRGLEVVGEISQDDMPSLRTVQRHVEKDPAGPWRLQDADPDEAALVFPVLAAVMDETEGRIVGLTLQEAGYIWRIRRIARDIAPFSVYRLAREYARRETTSAPTADLDLALGCATWRGEEEARRHISIAKASGQVAVLINPPDELVDELLSHRIDETWRVIGTVYLEGRATITVRATADLSVKRSRTRRGAKA